MLKKYILTTENDNDKKKHWMNCQSEKTPYIEVCNYSKKYLLITYDATFIDFNLEEISVKLKNIYLAYIDFLRLSDDVLEDYKYQYYYFNFLILEEHGYQFANYLFEYLVLEKS